MLGHHRRSAEALAKDEERLKEDMEKLYRLYLANEVPSKGFGDKYRPMDERVEQIQNERPTLQGEIDFLRIQYLSGSEIITEARDLYSRWTKMEEAEKRRIVEAITEMIQVGSGEIAINLSYLPVLPK